MNKLKIKYWLCLLSVIMGTILFQGCGRIDLNNQAAFGFIESEQVVEVDEETNFFRIMGKWTSEGNRLSSDYSPLVYLDTTNTTALHNVHFVNDVDTLDRYSGIGVFTALDSDKMYRDVELIPKNITSEKIIYYDAGLTFSDYKNNTILRLKVILRPKNKQLT